MTEAISTEGATASAESTPAMSAPLWTAAPARTVVSVYPPPFQALGGAPAPMHPHATPAPASATVAMPPPEPVTLVDPMSEESPETNAIRRFPPVSATRFVPVSRIPEAVATPSSAAPRGVPTPAAETFDPPPLEPPAASPPPLSTAAAPPSASSNPQEPLAEFRPAGIAQPDVPLTTFTPVAVSRAATFAPNGPASTPPATTSARMLVPKAAQALRRPEAGLASRIMPMRQAPRPAPTPPTPAAPAKPPADPPRAHAAPPTEVEQPLAHAGPLTGAPLLHPMHLGLPSNALGRTEPTPSKSRVPAILVVDDNADYRFVVVREMRRIRPNQIRIEEADGAQAALNTLANLVRENDRIFLLTDFRMPNQTGVDLVNAARRAYPAADIRYLVYSGINLRTAPELRTLGPDEFMEKPGDLIELRRQVSRLLDRWLGPVPQVRAA